MAARMPGGRSRQIRPEIGLAALFALVGAALGAPGDLDPAFGLEGRVIVRSNNASDGVNSIVQQADGKLLLGKEVFLGPGPQNLAVMRLNSDGGADVAFGTGGTAHIAMPDHFGRTRAVLQQHDGKVLVAGLANEFTYPFRGKFAFARYESDGTPDRSFGNDGLVLVDFGTDEALLAAVIEQPDGRLVAAGSVRQPPGEQDTAFARINADGSLDTTFGVDGRLVVNLGGAASGGGSYGYDAADALVRLPDGRLVAAGTVLDRIAGWGIVLVRLTAAGQLDTTFGTAGRAMPTLPQTFQSAVRLAARVDHGLVMASRVTGPGGFDDGCALVVLRMDADARPDPTFGTAGVASLRDAFCYFSPQVSGVAVAPDGSIVVGDATDGEEWYGETRVRRLNSTGQLDPGFGVNGAAIIDLGVEDAASNASGWAGSGLALQADGKIALASTGVFDGEFTDDPWEGRILHESFAVVRLRANGSSPGLVGLKRTVLTVGEAAGVAMLAVRRTGGSAGVVSVDFETANGTATSGADFTGTSGTLTWADGDVSEKVISLGISNDNQSESSESLQLTLTNPSGGAGLAASRAAITIDDDENPAPTQPAPPTPPGNPPASDSSQEGGGAADWLALLALLIAYCCREVGRSRRTL